jgi:benzoyl-CoA reductase/2-hydroxyglutaryl-CoA dehydratase subunit BcrC/BadD/HgdB
VGVPPIVDGLYEFLEQRGARVVYNEVQRQFAMLDPASDLAGQYTAYTYPYDTGYRLKDVKREVSRRGLQGLIHYAQTFCHRQIEAIILREDLPLPVISIEADRPGPLDARTQTRLEAFLEQLA